MNAEAFKLARATLRKAVKDYGWHRVRTEIGYFAHDHIADTYAKERTVTHVRVNYATGPGKFEGEHWAIVHYYDALMDGECEDEPFMDGETCAGDPFAVTDAERQAFGFEPTTAFVVLWHSENGFESLQELTAKEYDETRERYEARSVVTYTAPSAWASYLINGDDSGISAEDKAAADAWVESVGLGLPVSCEDAGFKWRHDAYGFMPVGADCQEYAFYSEGDL